MANNRFTNRNRRWDYSDEDEWQDMNRNTDFNRNRYNQQNPNFDYTAGDFDRDRFGNYDQGYYNQRNFNRGGYDYNRNRGYGPNYDYNEMGDYDRGYYDEGYGGWNDMGMNRGYYSPSRFNQGGYGYNRGQPRFGMRNRGMNQGFNQGGYGYNQGWNQGRYSNRGRFGYGTQGQTDYDIDTDFDYDYDMPSTWTYTEYWLIPGPFTGIGPENYQRSDDRISDDICDRLTQHGKLDASDVHVDVKDGDVTLTGTVKDRNQKRMAEDVAESVFGVTDVHNQLKVQKSGSKKSQQQGQTQNQP